MVYSVRKERLEKKYSFSTSSVELISCGVLITHACDQRVGQCIPLPKSHFSFQ